MSELDVKDITIVGGGPVGLFAAFYAGLRGISCRVVDALPQLGGQLMALYPEKYVFDVGGLPRILAKDLANNMIEQGTQFGPEVVLEAEVQRLEQQPDGLWRLITARGDYLTKTVCITAGKGALNPRVLECPGWGDFYGKEAAGLHTHVRQPEDFRGKRVLIVGGGDSAVDWVLGLRGIAREITLIHRRPEFRAHKASVQEMHAAVERGEARILTPYEVRSIHGDSEVGHVTLFNNDTDEDLRLDVEAVIALLGFKPDLGPIGRWGLDLEKNSIKVNQVMETNLHGVYAAGDVVHYPGKLELIATGYGEAAVAVNNAVHFIDPKARINPGHSTNLKIFSQD